MSGLEHRALRDSATQPRRSGTRARRAAPAHRHAAGASSLTASFLGAQTVQHTTSLGTLETLAIVALAVSIGSSVYVLLPKRGFVFSLNAVTLYEELFSIEDEHEVDRRLAYWLEGYWKANQGKVDVLGRYFFAAALALVLQLVFWTWALASTL